MIGMIDVNGHIIVTRHEDGSFSFDWDGGDVIAVTKELVEDATEGYMSPPPWELGDNVVIGPYSLKIIGVTFPYGDEYILHRNRDDQSGN